MNNYTAEAHRNETYGFALASQQVKRGEISQETYRDMLAMSSAAVNVMRGGAPAAPIKTELLLEASREALQRVLGK